MTPPTRTEFAAMLAGLDTDGFTRFLAALYAARGRSAEVAEGRVVFADGSALLAHAPPRYLPARLAVAGLDLDGADAVATTEPAVASLLRGRGTEVLGPADLRRMFLYAVDRGTADALCREHFGSPLEGRSPGPARRAGAAFAGAGPRVAVVAFLAASLVAAALLWAGGVAPPSGGSGTPGRPADAEPTADGGTGTAEPPIAPGLSGAGVPNATALAAAHADAVRARPYELSVAYSSEGRGANPLLSLGQSWTWIVRVGDGTTFRARVDGVVYSDASVLPERDTEVYADGTTRFVRRGTGDGGTVTRAPVASTAGASRFADFASALLGRFLGGGSFDTVERMHGDGRADYRVSVRGVDPVTGDDYEATALVAGSGFVSRLEVRYDPGRPAEGGRLLLEYGPLEGAIDPPWWIETAGNATDGTGTPGDGEGA